MRLQGDTVHRGFGVLLDRIANISIRSFLSSYLEFDEPYTISLTDFLKWHFTRLGTECLLYNVGDYEGSRIVLRKGIQEVDRELPQWIAYFRDILGTDSLENEYQVIISLYDIGVREAAVAKGHGG